MLTPSTLCCQPVERYIFLDFSLLVRFLCLSRPELIIPDPRRLAVISLADLVTPRSPHRRSVDVPVFLFATFMDHEVVYNLRGHRQRTAQIDNNRCFIFIVILYQARYIHSCPFLGLRVDNPLPLPMESTFHG